MKEEKIKFNSLVRQLNNRRYKKSYKLKDLVEVLGISYKSLKNMVGEIYNKYEAHGLILKEGRSYQIHYSMLDKFKLIQPRKTTIYSHEWKSNISWSTKNKYDKKYHEWLISELKKRTIDVNYIHTIEYDENKRLHVHMLADYEPEQLEPTINDLLTFYLENEYRLYCNKVNNKGSSVDYLIKNPQEINLI